MTFTFKKDKKETGLAGIANPNPSTTIKHNRKEVGTIAAPNWQSENNQWTIRLMVHNGKSWKWIQLKMRFDSEQAAREFIAANEELLLTLNLYYMDD